MPIEVINNAGSVLIDDSYVNFVLSTKGAVTLTKNQYNLTYVTITHTSAEQSVMLALELGDARMGHVSSLRTGNVWEFTVWFSPEYIGRVISYYIFTIPSAVNDAGGIMQLRNAAGQLTFDSNLKYMRVEGFYAVDGNVGSSVGQTLATGMATGRLYAAINVVPRYYNHHILFPPGQMVGPYRFMDAGYVGVNSRSGNSLHTVNLVTQQSSSTADNSNQWTRGSQTGRILIVDVTNF